jgi:hypothetical protein
MVSRQSDIHFGSWEHKLPGENKMFPMLDKPIKYLEMYMFMLYVYL